MLLSVVIVNYNVKSYLEQCLRSVCQSKGLALGQDFEIFVVDNHSVDDSVEMVREKFPQVRLIANQDNVGFAKANNQAIRLSQAKYVLLLNPDTLIEADSLKKCLDFMESHPDAGGLGVKMIDGQGKYLKESKRGLPTPEASFYKMSGLCKLFPRSRHFAAYYMGHLSPEQTNQVEILAGAFMMLRRECLQKTGLLDETFFMYGEDIDLSYRILLAGYHNYYFPETRIIHYKGESTKKGSLNYVMVFYKAMEIFAKKYFSKGKYRLYFQALRFAIWLRASLSVLSRLFKRLLLPVLDLGISYSALYFLSFAWPALIRDNAYFYPDIYRQAILPVYAVLFVAGVWIWKGYRTPISFRRTSAGFLSGIIAFLLIGALLGSEWQFSRFMAVAGGLLCLGIACLIRLCIGRLFRRSFPLSTRFRRHYLIVGSKEECQRVGHLLLEEGIALERIHTLSATDAPNSLAEQIEVNRIGQVIFCSKDLSFDQIVQMMDLLRKTGAESKIIAHDSSVRVGYKF